MATTATTANTKKKPFEKVRQSVKDYAAKLEEAYTQGYNDGWNAYGKIPKKPFAKMSAVAGYNKGLSNKAKSEKNKAKEEKRTKRLR